MLFLHIRNFSVLLHVKCHDFNVPVIQAFRNQREGIRRVEGTACRSPGFRSHRLALVCPGGLFVFLYKDKSVAWIAWPI